MKGTYKIAISLVLVLLSSCSTPPKIEPSNSTVEIDKLDSDNHKIDLEYIKNCSNRGFESFIGLDFSQKNDTLQNSKLNLIFSNHPVNDSPEWVLTSSEYEPFCCLNWNQNDTYFVFTFTQMDESCCHSVYICSTNLEGELLDLRFLGLIGGDGGWHEIDSFQSTSFADFHIFKKSEYDEDQFGPNGEDLGYSRKSDSTIVEMRFKDGLFFTDTVYHEVWDTLFPGY